MAYPLDTPRGTRVPHEHDHEHDRTQAHGHAHDHDHAHGRAPTHERLDPAPAGPRGPVGLRGVGLREATMGILGLFAVLGLALALLGFAAAFALDEAAEVANDGTAADDARDAAALGAAGLSILLVSLLPFLAAPLVALGAGAWAGHASRSSRVGGIAGAVGGFLGPILMLLLVGVGFALGAGAANLNLASPNLPAGVGVAPGWGSTLPYLATGAGLLWLLANALSGGLSGGLIGSLLDGWWDRRAALRDRRAGARRTTRV